MTAPMVVVPVVVTTRTPSGRDAYNNDTFTETDQPAVQGVFAPGDANGTGGNELIDARDTVIIGGTVYLPAGTAVTAVDRVTVGGDVFEVNGQPADWSVQPNPWSGWVPPLPVAVALRRVSG